MEKYCAWHEISCVNGKKKKKGLLLLNTQDIWYWRTCGSTCLMHGSTCKACVTSIVTRCIGRGIRPPINYNVVLYNYGRAQGMCYKDRIHKLRVFSFFWGKSPGTKIRDYHERYKLRVYVFWVGFKDQET